MSKKQPGALIIKSTVVRELGFCVTWHLNDDRVVKKVIDSGTYFGEFGYQNSSWIGKSIILLFLSSSRDKCTLL